MREIIDHIVAGDLPQNQLRIEVMDEPGAGGANHLYFIAIPGMEKNPSMKCSAHSFGDRQEFQEVLFQHGPIKEVGVNGITHEALLAIVIDRLRCFQAGPFPCRENQEALLSCCNALGWLKRRTHDRLVRGVEGETKP